MNEFDADYRQFSCTNCGAKLKARVSKAGKELPCPKCATVLVIPSSPASSPASETTLRGAVGIDAGSSTGSDTYGVRAAEEELRPINAPHEHSGPVLAASGKTTIPDSATPDSATESYAISEMSADGRSSDGDTEGLDAEDGQRAHRGLGHESSVRPTLPRWPLLQGVLVFLLEPGAIVYWSIISFLGTICVSLLLAAIVLGQSATAMTWLGSMFSHGITGVFGMVLVIVNAACCLTILQESAAGNRVIEDWPGFALIEYILETLYIVNSVLVSAAAAWLITYPLDGFSIARAFVEIGCFVVIFPIILLSMLEAGSCLLPASAAVYQSMRRSMRTWLVFFIESLVMAFGLLMYLVLLDFLLNLYATHVMLDVSMPIVIMTLAMGVGPAVLLELIYFRLLGRLAWVCDEDSRKELAEKEAEEEEQRENAEETEIRPAPVDDF